MGLALQENSPEVPSCRDCQQWSYDPKNNWMLLTRPDGKPRPRIKGTPLPCWKCPKSGPSNGKPAPEKELSAKNAQALAYYWQIKAGMSMPADAIVQRNCGLIEMMLAQIRGRRSDVQGLLGALSSLSALGGLFTSKK